MNSSRQPLDLYPTDLRVCLAVLRELVNLGLLFNGALLLEPHAGTGVWVDALARIAEELDHRYTVRVHDLTSHVADWASRCTLRLDVVALPCGDWLDADHRRAIISRDPIDLIIGNPPFAIVEPGKARGEVVAHRHVLACLPLANAVCMVLPRSLFTASRSAERRAFTLDCPAHYELHLGPPRPSFTGDGGTGNAEYDAAIWIPDRSHDGWARSKHLDWTKEST